MKKNILFALGVALSCSVAAQTFTEWHDQQVNAVNRAPMRTSHFVYAPGDDLLAGKEQSVNFMTLNGPWKFNWVENADQRPTDFFRTDFNDRGWATMPVPGLWELNGYGDPQYVNVGYPWRNNFRNNPPEVPVKGNHVGSYRRTVKVPADWKGKKIMAHFGSVTSNMYLWVNGKYVGYSEDSKLEAEFDLTPYLKPGQDNVIALQVFRWSDGTYLEDQDFFRLSGIGRDCYLYAREKNGILDIRVTPDLENGYKDGVLGIDLNLASNQKLDLVLTDAEGNKVAETKTAKSGKTEMKVPGVKAWSAETPYLYTLTVTTASGEKVQVKVGFRKIEMRDGNMLVNGQPVLIKGADRHELDPDGGYVVSPERMLEDITIMKAHNLNAVRTCHYPDDPLWYDLCDKYGIYVTAEANLESHGMGYGERSLAKDPAWKKAHIERNERNVQRNFNHPSIIVWSLGNEAGDGENFVAAYNKVKSIDSSRPVQYERAGLAKHTDIYCPMYASPEYSEQYAKGDDPRPLIQCEYAHAMGNSEGGFKEYWDMIRKYPKLQGGYIWDFVDQSLRRKDKDGNTIYAYGGDFNRFDASDNNFCDNGLISPDRVPNPHADEVKYYYQNIWITPIEGKDKTYSVYNENFFSDLSAYDLSWSLLKNGKVVRTGTVGLPSVAPQQKGEVVIDFGKICDCAEWLLNVEFKLRKPEGVLPVGHVVAREQIVLNPWKAPEIKIANTTAKNTPTELPAIDNSQRNALIVTGTGFRIEFNKRSGMMNMYDVKGTPMIEPGTELTPRFWRAPTDNDMGAGLQNRYAVWKNPELKLTAFDASINAAGLVEVKADYDLTAIKGCKLALTYAINNEGAVIVSETMNTDGVAEASKVPDLFRYGMYMTMPGEFNVIDYYGRGPIENYQDRNHSTFLGHYRQNVEDQFYPYIRPQETGNKTDVRSWMQLNRAGNGLMITSGAPFNATALNRSMDALDDGTEKDQRHAADAPAEPRTYIGIDATQMGLGCIDSWGSLPLKEYRLPFGNRSFTFKLTPVFHQF